MIETLMFMVVRINRNKQADKLSKAPEIQAYLPIMIDQNLGHAFPLFYDRESADVAVRQIKDPDYRKSLKVIQVYIKGNNSSDTDSLETFSDLSMGPLADR